MNYEVAHVSRGDIRVKSDDRQVRVLGEALMASAPTELSYVIYLTSLNNWEVPPDVALTEIEKREIIEAIRKHFHERGSIIEFE